MCQNVSGGKEQQRNKALTDNQRRAIPHAVLIDIVITQERSAYRLQVRVHEILPELENLGALNYAVLRQGYLVHRRVGLTSEKIPVCRRFADITSFSFALMVRK